MQKFGSKEESRNRIRKPCGRVTKQEADEAEQYSQTDNSHMVSTELTDTECPCCNAKKTVKYEITELYRESFCYLCTVCKAFAVEEEGTFALRWFQQQEGQQIAGEGK